MTDNNVVSINGRLTREAEPRFNTSGTVVLRFSIAVNRSVKKGDKWEDEASFFDCTMFGKMAESVSKYLSKGKQVSIIGELVQNRWEKDGQKYSKVEIIVNKIQLLGSRDDNQSYHKSEANSPENFQDDSGFFDDSQIPF